MPFDLQGARRAGYSDDEIAGFLSQENSFDLSAARKSGYTPSEVIDFLSAKAAAPDGPDIAPTDPMGTGAAEMVAASDGTNTGPSLVDRVGNELGQLRDEAFSGVQGAVAGVKNINATMLASRRQNAADAKARAEAKGDTTTARQMAGEQGSVEGRMPRAFAEAAEANASAARGSAMATRPAVAKVAAAKTWGEAWDAFTEAPYDVIAGVTAQSLPTTLPALAVGAIAGPAAGAIAMGANSGAIEAGSSLGDYARDHGVDVTNPQALEAFFSDKNNLAEALAYAGKRAGIIGSLDAVSGGLAGKTIAPKVITKQIARQAVNVPTQMAVQAGLGAAGEAGGQLATKGKIDQPGQVLMEAVGELGGAPSEVLAFGREARAGERAANPPAAPAGPTVQDLVKEHWGAAFDPAPIAKIATANTIDEAVSAANAAVDGSAAAVDNIGKILELEAINGATVGAAGEPAAGSGLGGNDVPGGIELGGRVPGELGPGGDTRVAPDVGGGPEAVPVGGADTAASPVATVTPAGTLQIQGETKALTKLLKDGGVTSILPMVNGVAVGRSQVALAQKLVDDFQAVPSQPIPAPAQAPVPAPAPTPTASAPAVAAAPQTAMQAAFQRAQERQQQAQSGEPGAVWFGRRGDGYQTEADAGVAMKSRVKVRPDLDWRIEPMPSGKFRLAGYAATAVQSADATQPSLTDAAKPVARPGAPNAAAVASAVNSNGSAASGDTVATDRGAAGNVPAGQPGAAAQAQPAAVQAAGPVVGEAGERGVPAGGAQPQRRPDVPGLGDGGPGASAASAGKPAQGSAPANPQFRQSDSDKLAAQRAEAPARVQKVVDRIRARWANAPQVQVVDSITSPEVPAAVRREGAARMGKGGGTPEAVIYQGKVYLFADQLKTDQDAARALLHESVGHWGLRSHFGREVDTILNEVALKRRSDIVKLLERTGVIDKGATPTAAQLREGADEFIAYLAENEPNAPVIQRLVAAIREWLRTNVPAFKSMELTDADIIANYIIPARRTVVDGAPPSRKAYTAEDAMAFSQGEPRTIQVDGVRRPADTASGEPIHPTFRGQQEFWRRYADRYETDDTGRPKVTPQEVQALLDENPDIRFSQKGAAPAWDVPAESKLDNVVYELQDGRIDLKRVQEAIKKAGRAIDEGFDARMAETLYPGRVARRSEQFLDAEVRPLLQAMAINKVGMDELADYLHARGAEERNAQIAKVNPSMPDGGAGTNTKGTLMTNAVAKQYLDMVPQSRKQMLDALAAKVDAITKGTRDLLVTEGLEKAETVKAWEGAYKNYVPMFRDEAESGAPHPLGAGFSVRGTSSKRATGSTKTVTNILAHVLMQREAAITRAEKNRVGLSLYGLALSHPNKEFWATITPAMQKAQIEKELVAMGVDPLEAAAGMDGLPTIRTVDPATNKVIDRPNPMYKSLPGAIALKIQGEDRVLMLNQDNERALRMAENLKNLDGLTRFDLAGSIVGKATRWMAAVNTQYNPVFGIVNGIRDTFGGAVNLTSTPIAGKSKHILANAYGPAWIGIAKEIAGKGDNNTWSELYRQFQEDGGKTGYREMFRDANDRSKAIEKELGKLDKEGKLTPGRAFHAMLGLLDGFNTTIENAVRVAAYKEALDAGLSRPAAAKIGRELTVDFNRKGRMAREIGPLYAFFNASLQGTARTVEALKGPAGLKIVAGGLALGAVQALLMAAAGFDDDEIPEWVKTRSFIFPTGKKTYIAIPLPLGLHVLPNTGRIVTELVLSDGKDMGKRIFSAVGEVAGAMSPLGGGNIFTSDGALRTIAPTVIDPLIELGFNRNFSGNQIERDARGETDVRPGFQRARESTTRSATGQVYLWISKAINRVMGGDDYEGGLASPTPERIAYLAQVAGGGVLREFEKVVNMGFGLAHGDSVKQNRIPLLSRFYGEVDEDSLQKSRYFESSKKVDKAQNAVRSAKKAGDDEAMSKIEAEHPELEMAHRQDRVAQRLAKLNRMAVTEVNDREEMKRLDDERVEVMREFNDDFRALEKSARKTTLGERLGGK